MASLTIYHNNRCSKSRDAMCILDEMKVKADVIEYLINTPSEEEIRGILHKLGMKASEIIRRGETVYREKFADKKMTEEQWIKALLKYPVLMERPIVIRGNKAVIARPAERLRELFR
ncbi:MAG: arsenate reductase (glutaredoxin) [Bacteroidia bacterium]